MISLAAGLAGSADILSALLGGERSWSVSVECALCADGRCGQDVRAPSL